MKVNKDQNITGPFMRPTIDGRGASGSGWFVAKVFVRMSPITQHQRLYATSARIQLLIVPTP